MRWSNTGTVSQNSLTCTLCMGKYVAMHSLLKGCSGNDFPTGIIRLDECLFLSISKCRRLVCCNEDMRVLEMWEPLEHPSLKRRYWDVLRQIPLQVFVVLHVKWVLHKVMCGEYSTSNNYTHITHKESMHCLWLTLHQVSHCASGCSNNGLIDKITSDSCCLLMRPHFIVMVFQVAGCVGWDKPSRCSRITPSSTFCCKYLCRHSWWQSHWAISSTFVSEWSPILEVLAKSFTWVVGGHTLGCSWEDLITTWRCTASLQCGCSQPYKCCISWSLDWKKRLYSMVCEVTWPESPWLFSMRISKVTCVWDTSGNRHGISCQNCSCLWCYSKHTRDICQGAAESCAMSRLHWGCWSSIWATVVRCNMVR